MDAQGTGRPPGSGHKYGKDPGYPVIAETAIALLLSLTRGLIQFAIPNFNNKIWNGSPPPVIVLDDLIIKL